MLGEIHRRKPSAGAGEPPRSAPRDSGALSAVELGAYGGLKAELEQLKRDKKVLVEEVVRLRQAQLSSEAAMHSMQHRLGATEARQQQMIAFLAQAMQHPAILAQFPGAGPAIHRIDDGRRKEGRRGCVWRELGRLFEYTLIHNRSKPMKPPLSSFFFFFCLLARCAGRKKRRGRSGVRGMTGDHELESEGSDTEAASPLGSAAEVGGDRRMIVHAGAGGGGSSQGGAQGGGARARLARGPVQVM